MIPLQMELEGFNTNSAPNLLPNAGLRVAKSAGMIPLQMELGGKDAALVLPDCNIKKTAAALVKGAFSYR
jgi:acyl-CoA reductase-like NAD-dependent aldehyde dehydrogenase